MHRILVLFFLIHLSSCDDNNQRQLTPATNQDNVEVQDRSQDAKSSKKDDDDDGFIGKSEDNDEVAKEKSDDSDQDENQELALGFERDIKTLAQESCESCHSGDEPAGGITLASKDDFEENIDAAIIAIEEESMPPADSDPSSASDPEKLRELLEAWQEEGFPN